MGKKTYILSESDIVKLLDNVTDVITKKVNHVVGGEIVDSLNQLIPEFCQKNLEELVCGYCEAGELSMCDNCLDEGTQMLTKIQTEHD